MSWEEGFEWTEYTERENMKGIACIWTLGEWKKAPTGGPVSVLFGGDEENDCGML